MMALRYVLQMALTGAMLLMVGASHAQTRLDATFTAVDQTFTIRYPSDWNADKGANGLVTFTGDGLQVTVFSTATIGRFVQDGDSIGTVTTSLASWVGFGAADALATRIDNHKAVIAALFSGGQHGAAILIDMGEGRYGLMVVRGDRDTLQAEAELIIEMSATYQTPAAESQSAELPQDTRIPSAVDVLQAVIVSDSSNDVEAIGSADVLPEEPNTGADSNNNGDNPQEVINTTSGTTVKNAIRLKHYADEYTVAIGELRAAGFIGQGGYLIFEEDRAFFAGGGNHYTGLARRSPVRDVVIAGELHFTVGQSRTLETCGLFARVTTNDEGHALEFVQVGLSNNAEVFYVDRPFNPADTLLRIESAAIDLSEPHHLLAVLHRDSITLFLDGQLIFEREPLHERAGIYGIGLTGGVRGSRCEGRHIWAYGLKSK